MIKVIQYYGKCDIHRSLIFGVFRCNDILLNPNQKGPVHTYPDSFVSAKIFIRFQKFCVHMHVFVSESFLVSTRKPENDLKTLTSPTEHAF